MPYAEPTVVHTSETEMKLAIKYSGSEVDRGRMDALALGPALWGVGEMVGATSRILYGDESRVRVEVHADFRHASFGIELFATSIADGILGALTSDQLSNIVNVLGFGAVAIGGAYRGASRLLKWQRNRTVDRVEKNGDQVKIIIGDQVQNISVTEYNVFIDPRVRTGFEALARPLHQSGIDQLSISVDDALPEIIDKAERDYFTNPPLPEVPVSMDRHNAILEIVALSFREGNKWRFAQGESLFYAAIRDKTFLERVARDGETFGAGDALRVVLEVRTTKTGKEYRYEFAVVEVLEHIKGEGDIQPYALDL